LLCGLAADSGQCTQRASTAGLQTAQWAITELEALLDFLSFSFSAAESQSLRNVFYSHCTWTIHIWTVALQCPVPQGPGVDY